MQENNIALLVDLHKVLLNENERVREADRAALERFLAKGGHFGVIADYPPAMVLPLLADIRTNTWSVILNGAEAYRFDRGTVAFPRVVSQLSMAAFLRQVILTLPEVSILLYSESRLFCLTDPDQLRARFRHGKPPFDTVGLETALRFPWVGVRFFGSENDRDQLEDGARSWGIYDLADCVHDEPGSSTFVPRGASKARCLGDLRVLDELRDKKMVIVGSGRKDAEYLTQGDVAIAAGNAHALTREAAAWQVPEGEECSLRYVIDEILPKL